MNETMKESNNSVLLLLAMLLLLLFLFLLLLALLICVIIAQELSFQIPSGVDIHQIFCGNEISIRKVKDIPSSPSASILT